MAKPHLIIKNKFQKRRYLYSDILTKDILLDICKKATGNSDYSVEFDNNGYNKGRLVTIKHGKQIIFVSLSEQEIKSRNSPLQSFPTTLNNFYLEKNKNKRVCFYFLPSKGSSFETNYFMFMYRLMKTVGVEFINEDRYLSQKIKKFTNLKDLIFERDLISGRNRRNKSTYLSKNKDNDIEIYGKTYGANKYETTLISLALNNISNNKVKIFQISEGDLNKLPAKSLEVLNKFKKIEINNANISLKPEDVLSDSKLRSPTYVYGLFRKLGDKKCSLCDCDDSELIQGAHIWPVAEIRKRKDLALEKRMQFAVDGENGIWLCTFHHRLFDNHMFMLSSSGKINFKSTIKERVLKNIKNQTTKYILEKNIISDKFIFYLKKRNLLLNKNEYLVN